MSPRSETSPSQHEARLHRLHELVELHGAADGCQWFTEDDLPRFALMERDVRGHSGGPWWNFGNDIDLLLHTSATQEVPEEWPAWEVFDLDSEWSSRVVLVYQISDEPE